MSKGNLHERVAAMDVELVADVRGRGLTESVVAISLLLLLSRLVLCSE